MSDKRTSLSSRRNLPKIEPGYQVGHLTVTEATTSRKNNYIIWKCECTCGGECQLDTRTLQRQTVTDCGCITRISPRQRDLTGLRFGRLVCKEPAREASGTGGTKWLCICDCGNQCITASKQLLSGSKLSCGCLGHPPLKDFIGKQFSQLTVMEYAGKRDGMHRWKCLCTCGNTTVVGQTLLQSGKTKSCGCLQAKIITDNLKLCQGTSVARLEANRKRLLRSNTSGYTGVYQDKRTGRWAAEITFKKKTYYLGSYANIEDAVKARKRGEEMYDDFLTWYYKTQEATESD